MGNKHLNTLFSIAVILAIITLVVLAFVVAEQNRQTLVNPPQLLPVQELEAQIFKLQNDLYVKDEHIKELKAQQELHKYATKQNKYAGKYTITHYEPYVSGTNITRSGKRASDGVGKWCATNEFPLGTELYIEGYGNLIVEDTGCPKGVIDILVYDKQTAMRLGRKPDVDVWVVTK